MIFITGGAHGIGLSLAKRYDEKGAKVAIFDINSEAIAVAQKELPGARFYLCDITKRSEVYMTSRRVLKEVGTPYILVNNAGVAEKSLFLDCDDRLLQRTMDVNVMAHFWILKAFLPAMIENQEGHICQIASAAGLVGVPGLTAYSASKHAVIGFSEALRFELKKSTKGKIKVTVVCPSFINTGMFEGAKPARVTPLLDQERITKIIFKAVDTGKERVLAPFMVKTLPYLKLLPPRIFNYIMKVSNMTGAMDDILAGSNLPISKK